MDVWREDLNVCTNANKVVFMHLCACQSMMHWSCVQKSWHFMSMHACAWLYQSNQHVVGPARRLIDHGASRAKESIQSVRRLVMFMFSTREPPVTTISQDHRWILILEKLFPKTKCIEGPEPLYAIGAAILDAIQLD